MGIKGRNAAAGTRGHTCSRSNACSPVLTLDSLSAMRSDNLVQAGDVIAFHNWLSIDIAT
jgi:hypothetical protein